MNDYACGLRDRLIELRVRHYGDRGRSKFASELGLGPSTYGHYEQDRTPPPEILVRAAELTKSNLLWLLTGDGEMHPESGTPAAVSSTARQLDDLLKERPDLKAAVQGFIEALRQASGH